MGQKSNAFISEISTGISHLEEEVKRCQDEIIKIRTSRRHIDEALDKQLEAAKKLTGHPPPNPSEEKNLREVLDRERAHADHNLELVKEAKKRYERARHFVGTISMGIGFRLGDFEKFLMEKERKVHSSNIKVAASVVKQLVGRPTSLRASREALHALHTKWRATAAGKLPNDNPDQW